MEAWPKALASSPTGIAVMAEILAAKFAEPTLGAKLVLTGDAWLIEGNTWGDKFWGVDLITGEGLNWLGRLVMAQRSAMHLRLGQAPK